MSAPTRSIRIWFVWISNSKVFHFYQSIDGHGPCAVTHNTLIGINCMLGQPFSITKNSSEMRFFSSRPFSKTSSEESWLTWKPRLFTQELNAFYEVNPVFAKFLEIQKSSILEINSQTRNPPTLISHANSPMKPYKLNDHPSNIDSIPLLWLFFCQGL